MSSSKLKSFYRLQEAGPKVNTKKSFFDRSEIEYMRYWITTEHKQPISKKVQAIQPCNPQRIKGKINSLECLISTKILWIRRSEILAPLTKMISKYARWQWTKTKEKAFQMIKRCSVLKYY